MGDLLEDVSIGGIIGFVITVAVSAAVLAIGLLVWPVLIYLLGLAVVIPYTRKYELLVRERR